VSYMGYALNVLGHPSLGPYRVAEAKVNDAADAIARRIRCQEQAPVIADRDRRAVDQPAGSNQEHNRSLVLRRQAEGPLPSADPRSNRVTSGLPPIGPACMPHGEGEDRR
jgi:hypothetical protein